MQIPLFRTLCLSYLAIEVRVVLNNMKKATSTEDVASRGIVLHKHMSFSFSEVVVFIIFKELVFPDSVFREYLA